MAKSKKVSKTTRFTKLITDFFNNFLKPLAIIADPIAGIVLYSLTLYFAWTHTQAHFKRMDEKAKRRGGPGPTANAKFWILAGRLFFDLIGLGLSIAILGMHLLGGYVIGTLGKAIVLGLAAFSMTTSSVLSTAHKFRRSFKPDAKLSTAEIGRLVMGIAGTVFLPLVLYGVISAAFLASPPVLLVGTVMVGVMGVGKGYNAYKAYKQQKILRKELEGIDTNLAQCIKESQGTLEKLFEIGDAQAEKLLKSRLKVIVKKMLALEGPKPVTEFQAFCASFEITRESIEEIAVKPVSTRVTEFLELVFPSEETSSSTHTVSPYRPSSPQVLEIGDQAPNSSPLDPGETTPLLSDKLVSNRQRQTYQKD
jgi:hypothetical protein